MTVEWDDDEFEKVTNQIVWEEAEELQAIFDRVLQAAAGKTVELVKILLAQELGTDMEISDEQLTEWAQLLADGTRIVVQPGS